MQKDTMSAFIEFARKASDFSTTLSEYLDGYAALTPAEKAEINLKIARLLFGKWTIEILTVIYNMGSPRFGEIKNILKGASSKVISNRLKLLEDFGMIEREVESGRPPSVRYRLTEDGRVIAKLGEPVFLFFGIVKGFYRREGSNKGQSKDTRT
ncbi:MAG: helix-turn-helix domain-containing protein [Conexivisphaerales archaeon]